MGNNLEELYSIYLKHQQVCTDTRKIIPGSLFFALKGETFNANSFAAQAIEKGCSFAIIDEEQYKAGEKYILVNDVLHTLQQLATFHRKQLNIPVIGITGTNGKTTTKELIHAVLSKKYKVCSTQGNFNNHIGVPLTILSIQKDIEIAVVEMGANHPNEIKELCEISVPDYGLITNIGKAHLEGFGSIEGVVKTKKELYDSIQSSNGKVFVCSDNSLLMNISKGIERKTYGVFPMSDCRGEIIESNPLLKIKWLNNSLIKEIHISTNLIGFYNFENVMAAICVGEYFGVNAGDIKDAIENYFPSNNRSQIIRTGKNTILMDAYNANPTSMEVSIMNFRHTSCDKKFVIIGDMLELGKESVIEHEKILKLIEYSEFENIILVGKVFCSLNKPDNFIAFNDVSEASSYIKEKKPTGFNILIKGSRGIKLEKLLEYL
jgi:UDP-N-acetylmuramoyl-tripeptide--D-alanyl-D-alanine ligase